MNCQAMKRHKGPLNAGYASERSETEMATYSINSIT